MKFLLDLIAILFLAVFYALMWVFAWQIASILTVLFILGWALHRVMEM